MCKTSVFFVSFPQPIMPRFFASGQISSLASSSAQGPPNVPVGLPCLSIATKLKSALEQSRAGGEEGLSSEEEESSRRSKEVFVVAAGAGGRVVAVNAGGGRKVAAMVAAGAVAVEFVDHGFEEFATTALTTSSTG